MADEIYFKGSARIQVDLKFKIVDYDDYMAMFYIKIEEAIRNGKYTITFNDVEEVDKDEFYEEDETPQEDPSEQEGY